MNVTRGVGPGQVPTLALLFVAYYVQCVVRYRLNVWAANADERIIRMEIYLPAGCIHLAAAYMAPAPALAAVNAAGFRNLAGNANVVLNPAGGARPGEATCTLAPDAGMLATINTMIRDGSLDTLATECMSLTSLEGRGSAKYATKPCTSSSTA